GRLQFQCCNRADPASTAIQKLQCGKRFGIWVRKVDTIWCDRPMKMHWLRSDRMFFPASHWHGPERCRSTARVNWEICFHIIEDFAIRGFHRHPATVKGDLQGLSAARRHLPDLIFAGAVGYKVDPVTVSGKACRGIEVGVDNQRPRRTSVRGDYV